jgi:hypothetical protein
MSIRLFYDHWQHHAHDLLEGEEMDAGTPALEIVAGAMPRTGVETDMVGVVVATEGEREAVDRDPVQLARVAIRLLDLADQGAVHRRGPSMPEPSAQAVIEAAVRSCTIDR